MLLCVCISTFHYDLPAVMRLPRWFQGLREYGRKIIGNKGKGRKRKILNREHGNKSCVSDIGNL